MPNRSIHWLAAVAVLGAGSCKDSPTPPAPDPTTTQYNITVRFFGPAMTAQQQALFLNAAARIETIITADIVNVAAQPIDLDVCPNVDESIPINEEIDDVLIFASIRSIDGQGQILASAGPCFTRPTSVGSMTAVGVMSFDSSDLPTLSQGGNLQDVITHEMLHVLGLGTLWTPSPSNTRNLLNGPGSADPRYTGPQARQGCIDSGGTIVCANDVPVEGNQEPEGTRDSHWRERTFDTEMMTGFLDSSSPLSAITIGGLADLGFVVNPNAKDPYTMPPTGFLPSMNSLSGRFGRNWEQLIRPVGSLDTVRPRTDR
jgi:hypothetical protein